MKAPVIFWALVGTVFVLFALMIVSGLMFARLMDVRKMEKAMRYAWSASGACTEDKCTLKLSNELPALPSVDTLNTTATYQPVVSRRLMDYVTRLSLLSQQDKTKALPVESYPGDTLLATFTPPRAPHFGAAWKTAGNLLVIAFRGTVTSAEIDEDMKANQVDQFEYGRIHHGFYNVFQKYQAAITQVVREQEGQVGHVLLAGHSLGGAMSQLMTVHLAHTFPSLKFTNYVFGCPRVGDETFAQAFTTLDNIVALWREVNIGDLIQELPPTVMPNLSDPKGELFLYTHAGQANVFETQWGAYKHNHSMACYIDFVNTLL